MEDKNQKSNSALREEKILEFWKENNVFQKTLEKDSPKGEYVFFEGPPTANGKPGIHHLEARAFKDVIPRYKTMRGYHVRRKGGWDTHGLPVELQVEKKLGLNSKKAIEEYGIAKFNQECKESVWEYLEFWNKFTERIGFWVDQKNPYVTYHNDYIESVWNVIKEADKKKLLYKDYKVVPWCPRCGTALSSHELAQGYENVKDLSVYVKFRLIKASSDTLTQVLGRGGREPVPDHSQEYTDSASSDTYILAWTTTPWTLPGNVALAVGADIDYVKISLKASSDTFYILARERLSVIDGEYQIVEEFKGKNLTGLEYEPLYPFLRDNISGEEAGKLDKAFKVYDASFVTTEDGTGVVHTAVMYGHDDFNLGTKIGLPKHHMVGLDGKFLMGTDFLEGRFVRDEETAVEIIKDLAHRGLLLKKEKYEHSYPHCWRCKTALIYYARDSWYIKMTLLRDQMVKENEGINWEPAYIKEGRFGEWLSDIKDWAISRERYWGTPLPVWSCDKCKKIEVLGSVADIKLKTKKSGNRYFVMRHGETECNIKGEVSSTVNNNDRLTKNGISQVEESASLLKDKNIDLIITSPFIRTKETVELLADQIGYDKEKIIFDDRLHEMSVPMYEGRKWMEYHNDFPKTVENFYKAPEGNESYDDVRRRSMSVLYDLESKFFGKNILIVTHGSPAWLMVAGVNDLSVEETLGLVTSDKNFNYLSNGNFTEIDFISLPHNEKYELDLHKPYIDEVELQCSCGGKLERTKEVMDVWLDSGTMPFSQDHYPFENKEWVEGKGYPADFISEAIDQTRGWFYTLHAVGAIMGKGKAYKNVICLGHILDANGKKMSKSLGNIVDPWVMIDKYGVDTLRMWMYGVNQPGESKNFDEKTVSELHNKVFNLLYNILSFYELYRDKNLEKDEYKTPNNILDQWILMRMGELDMVVTNSLDNYKLFESSRAIRDFIDELSTWYLRRSRERIKNGDKEAKQTLYFVLKTLVKIMAPFTPFASEDIWNKLKTENDVESVHLADWPQIEIEGQYYLIEVMKEVRKVVTLALQKRQKDVIPVRQPLKSLSIKKIVFPNLAKSSDSQLSFLDLIVEEINVKNVMIRDDLFDDVVLDTNITEELKKEGQYRELLRGIQDARKKKGLNPNDVISLIIETNVSGQEFINSLEKNEFLNIIGAKDLRVEENNGTEVKIDDFILKIELVK